MERFVYNDTEFFVAAAGPAWDILAATPNGGTAPLAVAVFPGVGAADALVRARELVRAARPVGVRVVGPDVARPGRVGDLRIVGPAVTHPNFIRWDKDSSSFPRQD